MQVPQESRTWRSDLCVLGWLEAAGGQRREVESSWRLSGWKEEAKHGARFEEGRVWPEAERPNPQGLGFIAFSRIFPGVGGG